MKPNNRPINNTSPATDVAQVPLFHTSQPNTVGSGPSFAKSGPVRYFMRQSMCSIKQKWLSFSYGFNPWWQYYVLIHLLSIVLLLFLFSLIWFCIFLAVSFCGHRIPYVALSASVIDRHVRWQIDHYSHRRLWPSTTPSSFLSLLICLGDVFWAWVSQPKTPHLILPFCFRVPSTSLWPAVKVEDNSINVFAPCLEFYVVLKLWLQIKM